MYSPKQEDILNPSRHSSYSEIFETSGVIIRDFEGSISKSPPTLAKYAVTYNLNKCKANVIVPYYKLLALVAWRPFGKNLGCPRCCIEFWNYIYTFFCFCILLFYYYVRTKTCQGQLNRITSAVPDSPKFSTANSNNVTIPFVHNPGCQHIAGMYIVPSIMHFSAFVLGFFYFRVYENEGLYALMEKVYLQIRSPTGMTKTLRLFLFTGIMWLFMSLANTLSYFFVFGLEETTGIRDSKYVMYSWVVAMVLAELFSNCVCVAITLSYSGQCKLLSYYIHGVMERLEEKSTELKFLMQEILDIRQCVSRLNGKLAFSMSCLVFYEFIAASSIAIMLFNYKVGGLVVWLYRSKFVQDVSILAFLMCQAALLTSGGGEIRKTALAIRVFGYQGQSQSDIDSFLNFLSMVDLEAEFFTIPVKAKYLWGMVVVGIQLLIIGFQTGLMPNTSKWF